MHLLRGGHYSSLRVGRIFRSDDLHGNNLWSLVIWKAFILTCTFNSVEVCNGVQVIDSFQANNILDLTGDTCGLAISPAGV